MEQALAAGHRTDVRDLRRRDRRRSDQDLRLRHGDEGGAAGLPVHPLPAGGPGEGPPCGRGRRGERGGVLPPEDPAGTALRRGLPGPVPPGGYRPGAGGPGGQPRADRVAHPPAVGLPGPDHHGHPADRRGRADRPGRGLSGGGGLPGPGHGRRRPGRAPGALHGVAAVPGGGARGGPAEHRRHRQRDHPARRVRPGGGHGLRHRAGQHGDGCPGPPPDRRRTDL